MHDHPHEDALEDDDAHHDRFDLRELLRLHPRLILAACIVAVLMVPVGMFVAALGVWVLDFSGGAARDTSVVVGMAGVLVSDFWGGGLVTALTKVRAAQVAVAWGIARLLVLLLLALVVSNLLPILPIQLALAIPAAYVGARVARKQAALRRQIELERASTAEA